MLRHSQRAELMATVTLDKSLHNVRTFRATSVPDPEATPALVHINAGASFTSSPTIAMVRFSGQITTRSAFRCGKRSAYLRRSGCRLPRPEQPVLSHPSGTRL